MTRIAAGLVAYAGFLVVLADAGQRAADTLWAALAGTARALVTGLTAPVDALMGLASAPEQLLEAALPALLTVLAAGLTALAAHLIWPVTEAHAPLPQRRVATSTPATVRPLSSARATARSSRAHLPERRAA